MSSSEDRVPSTDGECAETAQHSGLDEVHAVLDAVRQPLLLIDEELCILSANLAFRETFPQAGSGIVGLALPKLLDDGSDLAELDVVLRDILDGHRQLGRFRARGGFGAPSSRTLAFDARRLGETRRLLLAVEPVDGNGEPEAAASGDERLERERHETERMDDFLGILGHELRTPLSAIHNVSRLLNGKRSREPERVDELHRILSRQTDLMLRLVDDLMDFSRVNAGVLSLKRQRIRLRECIVVAVNGVEIKADNAALTMSVDLPSEDLWLDADPVRVTQVISNLLDNAIKYNASGGSVGLAVRREGDEAVIRVRDSGIGIEPEQIDSVFDVFTRLGSRGRGQQGLGLGLALVRQFVKLHGGEVTAHSDGGGRGSEFVVRLPLAAGEEGAGGRPEPARPSSRSRTRRILLVDDNADSVDTLAGLLEEAGHEVRAAYSGPAALEIVEGFDPEVVLLDIGMPDMDGFELARRLRSIESLEGVRLVALTGYGRPQDLREMEAAGFSLHVLKPVRLDDLDLAIFGGERSPNGSSGSR